MKRVGLFRLLAVVLFLAVPVSAAFAVDMDVTRQTLRGLSGVYVNVEEVQPNIGMHAKRFGLAQDQLRADVERRLRERGIRVLSKDEWLVAPGRPVLYVCVNTHETERFWYAYDIKIELQQMVRMEANPDVRTLATTWSVSMTGMTNVGKLQVIRDDVGVLVGKFIDAFKQ